MKYRKNAPQQLNLDLIASSSSERQESMQEFDSKDCDFCLKHKKLTQFNSELIHIRYFETFNFYFAKPINEILSNYATEHVILFKDFLFYYDDNEYLKRSYRQDEVPPRMAILTDFYANQYKETRPNLCSIDQFKIILKRNQKQAKLFLQKITSQDEQPSRTNKNSIKNKILPDRISDNFSIQYSQSDNNESEAPKLNISWDSQSHNIFEITQSIRQSLTRKRKPEQSYNNNAILRNFFGLLQENNLYSNENDSDLKDMISHIVCQMNLLQIKGTDICLNKFKKSSNEPLMDNYSSNHQSSGDRKNPLSTYQQDKIPEMKQKLSSIQKSQPLQSNNASSNGITMNINNYASVNPNIITNGNTHAQETILIRNLMKKYDLSKMKKEKKEKKATIVDDKVQKTARDGKPKNTITDEVLLKIYRQHVENVKKLSAPIKRKLIKGSYNSQSQENLTTSGHKLVVMKKQESKKTIKKRDSQSSENSTTQNIYLRNQYHSQSSYKNPITQQFQSLQVQQQSTSVNNPTLLNINEENENKVNKNLKSKSNQRNKPTNNKIYISNRNKGSALQKTNKKNANFSQLTISSPSTTQLIMTNPKFGKLQQNMDQSKQEQRTIQQVYYQQQSNQSQSQLLRSLSSNPSITQSPLRRVEIKVNLNKLIQKQEEELHEQQKIDQGYWTQRVYPQNASDQASYQSERLRKFNSNQSQQSKKKEK